MFKKTVSLTAILAALALPVFAADVPADQVAATTQASAEQAQNDVDLSGLTGFATDFTDPDKKLYNKGQQVAVESQLINNANQLILYPQVQAKHAGAAKAINATVNAFVADIRTSYDKVMSTYDIKADGNGLFSYVVYVAPAKGKTVGSHPIVKGFTFDTKTGAQYDMAHFGTFSPATVNQGLKMDGYMKDKLTSEVTTMPSEFFVDQAKTVYSIIPEGVVADASEGTLYVPVGKAK